MKNYILMLLFVGTAISLGAQIGEVKADGYWAKIYDENARYTGKSIALGGDKYIKNVSGSAILVKDGYWVKYYDFDGRYTGKSTPDK